MRLAVVAILAASLPVLAQPPSTFRSSAAIELAGKDALHELELPFEAYRDARRDLADVRIFNAKGDAVPIAWAGMPPPQLEAAPPLDLPIFPVSKMEAGSAAAGAEVTVRAADGTLVAVKSRGPAAKDTVQPKAYLLDASKAAERMKAILFGWETAPGSEIVNVRVEASEDLKTWSALGAGAVVKLEANGRMLHQPRVEFPPTRAKYFRVTWDGPAFALKEAKAEHEPRGIAPKRRTMTVAGQPGAKPDEFLFDLGARIPVEALRLVPAQTNSILSIILHTGDEPAGPFRPLAQASFYRLQHAGAELQSPPIEIGRRPARYWLARLIPGSSAGAPPTMEVEWRSASLVFVAQGEGPFHLAFGNPQAASTALPLATLVPTTPTSKLGIGAARVGPVRAGPPPTRWEKIVGEVDARRVTLWTILAGGVAALGFMAWRLSKQPRG